MKRYKYIYILGIGGAAMSSLAKWFIWQGKVVVGYDSVRSTTTDRLTDDGAAIHYDSSISSIPDVVLKNKSETLVLYTPALGDGAPLSHDIFRYLLESQFTFAKRSDIFASITSKHFTIAIAGTHGKTSTTALLAHILHNSDKKIVSFIGGTLSGYHTNFLTNCTPTDDYIVVIEADEYDRFFLSLTYDLGVVTTSDPDHLDYYISHDIFKKAFCDFIDRAREPNGIVYVHIDAFESLGITSTKIQTYGTEKTEIYPKNLLITADKSRFDYVNRTLEIDDIQLVLPGIHHVQNTVAVASLCLSLGLEKDFIRSNILSYSEVERRFNIVINTPHVVVIDDFAHHPVEIEALLRTVRTIYREKKVTLIFQPHTYTRTRDFLHEFATVLSTADSLILLGIFPARERDIYGVSSNDLLERVSIKNKAVCYDPQKIVDYILQSFCHDVVLVVGAGDIAKLVLEPIKSWAQA